MCQLARAKAQTLSTRPRVPVAMALSAMLLDYHGWKTQPASRSGSGMIEFVHELHGHRQYNNVFIYLYFRKETV